MYQCKRQQTRRKIYLQKYKTVALRANITYKRSHHKVADRYLNTVHVYKTCHYTLSTFVLKSPFSQSHLSLLKLLLEFDHWVFGSHWRW